MNLTPKTGKYRENRGIKQKQNKRGGTLGRKNRLQ
jgi:hypothetical protein